jgi:hypothetical protein
VASCQDWQADAFLDIRFEAAKCCYGKLSVPQIRIVQYEYISLACHSAATADRRKEGVGPVSIYAA